MSPGGRDAPLLPIPEVNRGAGGRLENGCGIKAAGLRPGQSGMTGGLPRVLRGHVHQETCNIEGVLGFL